MPLSFSENDVVVLGDDEFVLFRIVHIKDNLAWIEPYDAHRVAHRCYHRDGEEGCRCRRNHVVDISRLSKFGYQPNHN